MNNSFYNASEKNAGTVSGRVSSLQTLGTLDGPGVRFVVFMQGCPLRCGCCHNPETWETAGGTLYTAEELVRKAVNYREYFGSEGGITLSGGEPLLQPEFSAEIFRLCHKEGINTCLDTSGCILNDRIEKLLEQTDYCMLDIKYTSAEHYKEHVGCDIAGPLAFLEYLNEKDIPARLRQVIIPGLNDNADNIAFLNRLREKYPCIKKTELLPFKKLCETKYKDLKIDFPFAGIPEPSADKMKELENLLIP